ncbi:hypothetical protein [Nitrospirillum pindoramense]|uniref:Transglutaminase superfamily protein n=1 Tax=Nitrospirillum amazonense TaxID=28077 RepID=A0A560HFZ4_9PROT|nr:hypothetical protein [Nitrospirillum amazonense]TWB44529.1 hypothetical protein FBZ90_103438 [Nitrospirillum amazonense]
MKNPFKNKCWSVFCAVVSAFIADTSQASEFAGGLSTKAVDMEISLSRAKAVNTRIRWTVAVLNQEGVPLLNEITPRCTQTKGSTCRLSYAAAVGKDGTRREIDVREIGIQQGATTQANRQDMGIKFFTIPFSGVRPGDRVIFEITTENSTSEIKDSFSTRKNLQSLIIGNGNDCVYDISVITPADLPVHTATSGFDLDRRVEGGTARLHFHGTVEGKGSSAFLALSTFKTDRELGDAYLATVATIADGATGATENPAPSGTSSLLENFYAFASTKINDNGKYILDGRYIPRPLEDIKKTGYGDCKDKSYLLVTTLNAIGINANMALVGSRATVSPIPVIDDYNHMLVYLPDQDRFIDPDLDGTPLGNLASSALGKPVLILTAGGSRQSRIPDTIPGTNEIRLETRAEVREDGSITGQTSAKATGYFDADLRLRLRDLMPAQDAAVGDDIVEVMTPHQDSRITFPAPAETASSDLEISATFETGADTKVAKASRISPVKGVRFAARPGDYLVGDLASATASTDHCLPGRQVEELRLKMPPGTEIRSLPEDKDYTKRDLVFRSRWKKVGTEIVVQREFISLYSGATCATSRDEIAAFLDKVRDDYRETVSVRR